MTMLEPDPHNRPSAAECVQLLSGPPAPFQEPAAVRPPVPAAASFPTEPTRTPRTPVAPAARSRSSKIALSAVALIAVAAGGAAVTLWHGTAKGTGPAGPAATVTSSGTPVEAPAADVWIAQLASVPVSAGSADLQKELRQVRAEIPGAQYLISSDYASLKPGYWVIYYLGSFSDGSQAIQYCAAHGRISANQCVGRFLSHDPRDKIYICVPPGGDQEKGCSRRA